MASASTKTYATVTLSGPARGFNKSYWELETLFTPPSNVAGQLCHLIPRVVNLTSTTKAAKVFEAYSTYFLSLDLGQPYNSSSINKGIDVDVASNSVTYDSGYGTGIITNSGANVALLATPTGSFPVGSFLSGGSITDPTTTVSSGSGLNYIISPTTTAYPTPVGSGTGAITDGTGALTFTVGPTGTISVGDYIYGSGITFGTTVITAKTSATQYTVTPTTGRASTTLTAINPNSLASFTARTKTSLSGVQADTSSSVIATLVTDSLGNIINLNSQPRSLIRVPHTPENVRLILQPTNMTSYTLADIAAFTVVFELVPVL